MVEKYNGFETLLFRQKAKELAVKVYNIFRDSRDFGFKDQIQRATISISNNIAEGFERNSDREFQRFLYIAKGSC
jgi:four helix bundle protein